MSSEPHRFSAGMEWEGGLSYRMKTEGRPEMTAATPPVFGGPEGFWSPEELFVASVGSCILSTFLYFTRRFELPLEKCSVHSEGTMEKTPQGLRFTRVDVRFRVRFADRDTETRAASLRLKEKLEKYCPISASLKCPVEVSLETSAP